MESGTNIHQATQALLNQNIDLLNPYVTPTWIGSFWCQRQCRILCLWHVVGSGNLRLWLEPWSFILRCFSVATCRSALISARPSSRCCFRVSFSPLEISQWWLRPGLLWPVRPLAPLAFLKALAQPFLGLRFILLSLTLLVFSFFFHFLSSLRLDWHYFCHHFILCQLPPSLGFLSFGFFLLLFCSFLSSAFPLFFLFRPPPPPSFSPLLWPCRAERSMCATPGRSPGSSSAQSVGRLILSNFIKLEPMCLYPFEHHCTICEFRRWTICNCCKLCSSWTIIHCFGWLLHLPNISPNVLPWLVPCTWLWPTPLFASTVGDCDFGALIFGIGTTLTIGTCRPKKKGKKRKSKKNWWLTKPPEHEPILTIFNYNHQPLE